MIVKHLIQMLFVLLLSFTTIAQANKPIRELIPSGDGLLYYKTGGGRGFAFPPVSDTTRIPLDVRGDMGLGYSCGVFNPASSFTNTLNSIGDSVQNIDRKLVDSMTGMILSMPMYVVSRADSRLAQMINNSIFSAKEDFSLSLKTCEQMESDALNNRPVFDDVMKVSAGHRWKKEFGVAIDTKQGDVNKAKKEVAKDQGRSGVPWLGGKNAGGSPTQGQKPIYVIADTAKAGYNILLDRDVARDNPPAKNVGNHYMTQVWPSPKNASDWLVSVVGDIKLTSCNDNNCEKGTEPGKGLKQIAETTNKEIHNTLQKLVIGEIPLTQDNLDKVAAPGTAMNTAVITAIRNRSLNQQAALIDKLSTEITTQRVIDNAFMAKRLLSTGRQIPEIANNIAVWEFIDRAISQLDEDINTIVKEHETRKSLSSNTITALLEYDMTERMNALNRPQQDFDQQPMMRDGAIHKDTD